MRSLLCKLGIHKWFTSPGGNRRGCTVPGCGKRQVKQANTYGGSLDEWVDHTYPLDADPHKDPTPCRDAYGDRSTVGFENLWADAMRKAQEKYGSRQ